MSTTKWDLKAILAALRDQRWSVTPTAQARWKCVPPDPNRDIVIVAETSSWTAQRNTIKDLRRSGFVWPPAAPAAPAPAPENAAAQATLRAIEGADERLERVWRELRDARGYLVLVDEHLEELAAAIDRAARAWHEAHVERGLALDRLRAAKEAFDAAFGGVTDNASMRAP